MDMGGHEYRCLPPTENDGRKSKRPSNGGTAGFMPTDEDRATVKLLTANRFPHPVTCRYLVNRHRSPISGPHLNCMFGPWAQPDLMVTRIDRLAGSVGDLQHIVRQVTARGASLQAAKQPIDPGTALGKCLLDIRSAHKAERGVVAKHPAECPPSRRPFRRPGGRSPAGVDGTRR